MREAVRAALAQDYEPLEIIISDDASKDASFEIAKEEVARYRGPHQVVLNRNPSNLNIEHICRMLELARGQLLVRGHGDDVVRPDRTRRLVESWLQTGASLVTSNAEMMTEDGRPLGRLTSDTRSGWVSVDDLITHGNLRTTVGSTFATDRDVYDRFPRIDRTIHPVGLDHLVPFRAALLNGVYYLDEPLLRYRQHDRSMSSLMADKTGERDSYYETICAHNVWAQLCRLDELAAFRAENPGDPRLSEIRQKLELRIISLTGLWIGFRRDLLARGSHPAWIDLETFGRREIRPELLLPATMPTATGP